ncbi:hypothetical protein MCEMOHM34_00744 [Candidatus Methylopumilus universalis]|uniref:hypothetical protein n=1 Tax=Candidatus Methylopumilus universalis TaxID=2588536 RepID=UPI003BEF3B34
MNKLSKKILIGVLFSFVFSYTYAETNAFNDLELAKIQSAQTPREKCNEYVNTEGFTQGQFKEVGGQSVMLICGSAPVLDTTRSNNFLQSRSNAFDAAMLNAKESYSSYIVQNLKVAISSRMKEGDFSEQPQEEENDDVSPSNLFDKLKVLANAEADTRLAKKGLNPDGKDKKTEQAKQEELKKILSSSEFKKTIESYTTRVLTGMQVNKVFESCVAGNVRCEISLAMSWSDNSVKLAEALSTGNASAFVTSTPGKKLPSKFETSQVLANVGPRLFKDENGNYFLLATAIVSPASKSQISVDMAYDKAKLSAQSFIRTFASENLASDGYFNPNELLKKHSDGSEVIESKDKYERRISSISDSLKLSGISKHSEGKVAHPANPDLIGVYHVALWSLGTLKGAQDTANKLNQPQSSGSKKIDQSPMNKDVHIESQKSDF